MVNKKIIDESLQVKFMGNSNLVSTFIPKDYTETLPRISEIKKDKVLFLENIKKEKEAIKKQQELSELDLLKSSTATMSMDLENPFIKQKTEKISEKWSIPKVVQNALVSTVFIILIITIVMTIFNNRQMQVQNSNQIISNDLISSVNNVIITDNTYSFTNDTLDDGKNVVLTLKNEALLLSYKVPLLDNPNIDYLVYKDTSLKNKIDFKPTYSSDNSKVKHLYIYLSKDMYDVVKNRIAQ